MRIQQRELRGDAVAYPQWLGDKVVVGVLLLVLTSVKILNNFDGQDEFGKRCQRVLVKKCCVRKVIQTSETSNLKNTITKVLVCQCAIGCGLKLWYTLPSLIIISTYCLVSLVV